MLPIDPGHPVATSQPDSTREPGLPILSLPPVGTIDFPQSWQPIGTTVTCRKEVIYTTLSKGSFLYYNIIYKNNTEKKTSLQ